MKTALFGMAAVIGLIGFDGSAKAQGISIGYSQFGNRSGFGIAVGGPVYRPYYSQPYYAQPVVVQQTVVSSPTVVETVQPQVVYQQTAPVYVSPAPVFAPAIGFYGSYGYNRGYYRPYGGGYGGGYRR